MNRVSISNYVLSFIILASCAGALICVLVSGNISITKTDHLVVQTYDVINNSEKLSTFLEGAVSAQRGYIISGQVSFLRDYDLMKKQLLERVLKIHELTIDNPSQRSRISEMKNHLNQLLTKLEDRASKYKPSSNITDKFLDDVKIINELKTTVIFLNGEVLREEYDLLKARISSVEVQRVRYFNTLLFGILAGAIGLMLFNGFLLKSQRKHNDIEASLQDNEQRFQLAIEGTQDGIFDWNIKKNEVFYSARLFAMVGHKKNAFIGKTEDFGNLIHPEDAPRVWKHVEDYFSGSIPEYHIEFRTKHKDGHWVWIQSRARYIADKTGKPIRFVGAHTDISLLKERQTELEIEKNTAEQASKAKSDFLAHMSHEIRTPLTAICGIAEIFKNKKDNLDEKQRILISTLYSSTSNLKDLINNILDFSKIESRELELTYTNFEISGLFEELISMMSFRASNKGISFFFNYDSLKNFVFFGDKIRIRQILLNLIGNAIKFTHEGSISVSAHLENKSDKKFLSIEISDTGIGISPDNFDLIFERFKQADASVSRKYGGTGLGLSISKNLTALMGGSIVLNSQKGKGSTFTLLLPDKKGSFKSVSKIENLETLTLNEQIKSSVDGKTKILIVEDHLANVTVLSYVLDDFGCPYDIAHNGKQAVDMWKENVYSVILMDVQMPIMDGFTATNAIRKVEKERGVEDRIPIIAMSAHALVGDKDKCIEAGMDAYLPKPLIEEDLKKEIFKYINKTKKTA